MPTIQLKKRHLEILEAIIAEHLPDEEVWAYGSRVGGNCHDASDLDIVVRHPGNLNRRQTNLMEVKQAIGESNLPILVDVLDWAVLPESFQHEIKRQYCPL